MNYFDHNDAKGRDARIRVQINREEQGRTARALNEWRDFGNITLYMNKHEVRARRMEPALNAAFESLKRESRSEYCANQALANR